MKQIILALVLIAAPVFLFGVGYHYLAGPAPDATGGLGDLSALQTIVKDTAAIAATGDLTAAEQRITDFESAWDAAEGQLRPLNVDQWGAIDGAADGAIKALRAGQPDAATVEAKLTALAAVLDDPAAAAGTATGALVLVAGIAVTDANGRAIPCEEMLTRLRGAMGASKASDADKASAADFQARATERCNADDDQHADEFSAQGLALVSK